MCEIVHTDIPAQFPGSEHCTCATRFVMNQIDLHREACAQPEDQTNLPWISYSVLYLLRCTNCARHSQMHVVKILMKHPISRSHDAKCTIDQALPRKVATISVSSSDILLWPSVQKTLKDIRDLVNCTSLYWICNTFLKGLQLHSFLSWHEPDTSFNHTNWSSIKDSARIIYFFGQRSMD